MNSPSPPSVRRRSERKSPLLPSPCGRLELKRIKGIFFPQQWKFDWLKPAGAALAVMNPTETGVTPVRPPENLFAFEPNAERIHFLSQRMRSGLADSLDRKSTRLNSSH